MSTPILQYDESETWPRIRRSLVDKVGITCTLVASGIGGVRTPEWTLPAIDLYNYVRPSTGQTLWIIEAKIFYPPDIELFRSWVVGERPSDDEIREIVAADRRVGD